MKCNKCKCNFALENCKYDFLTKEITEITLFCGCEEKYTTLTKKDIDDKRWGELVELCYALMCL